MKIHLNYHFLYITKTKDNLASSNSLTYKGAVVILSLWLITGMLIYLPDNGGSGLTSPSNIISWCVMALLSLWLAFRLPDFVLEPVASTPKMHLLPLGALLWSLPLCWSPSKSAMFERLPHVVALWGLLCFLWLIRRMPLNAVQRRGFLLVISAAAFLQSIVGFVKIAVISQATSHSAGYTLLPGLFQQPTALASFVATGIICLVASRHKGALANFALLFMSFVLVLMQSRAEWMGTGFGMLLIAIASRQHDGQIRHLLTPFSYIVAGASIAYIWHHGCLDPILNTLFPGIDFSKITQAFILVNKKDSTLELWAIIKTTWRMILQHPFLGTGYGGFESAFTLQAQKYGSPFASTLLTHPHSEILYAWSEGGLPALVGLLLMAADIFWMLWRRGGWRWEGLALLMPIIIHINLEYPLYLSAPHALTLVMLLRIALAPAGFTPLQGREFPYLTSKIKATHVRWSIIGIGLGMLIYMTGALQTQQRLTAVERDGLIALLPESGKSVESELWNTTSQYQRLDYDRHIALLVHYNMTRNTDDLKSFDIWAMNYLLTHNDAYVYLSELKIHSIIHSGFYNLICSKAHNIWPNNHNFDCFKNKS